MEKLVSVSSGGILIEIIRSSHRVFNLSVIAALVPTGDCVTFVNYLLRLE